MSRSALLVLLALSALSLTYLDHRAGSCGDGFVFGPFLPLELGAEWFNGTFWLTDGEG